MFSSISEVKMYDTDAAGILYFANQFRFVHDTWDAFLSSKGMPIQFFMNDTSYLFVIVYVEASYMEPVFLGDVLTINMDIESMSTSSVTFSYTLFRDDVCVGTAKTVHVSIDKMSRKKIPIPKTLKQRLL